MSSSDDEKKPSMKSVVQVKSSWKDNHSESDSGSEGDERDWRKRRNASYIEKDSYVDERYDNGGKFNSVGDTDEDGEVDQDHDKENLNETHSRKRKHNEKRRRSPHKSTDSEKEEPQPKKNKETKKNIEDILTKAGGAYIPPSKLRQMQENITDKSSTAYQRMSWEALKKSINGLVNKVNISNIGFIVEELLQENIIRGRGLLCQSIMRAQVASPTFTNVYAGLVSIINTKFPKIGELLVRRLIIQFRKSFKRNDKPVCINSVKFLAHLVNQQVIHELLALEVLTLLLKEPSSDSVEVAISFLKEVGQKLMELSPRGISAVFESLRKVLHSPDSDKRVQYMIEVMYAIRKDGFKDFPSVVEGLDLVEEDDQITHLIRLNDAVASEDLLNVFKADPNFQENEDKYKQIRSELLESDDGDSDDSDDSDGDDNDNDDGSNENQQEQMEIIDKTETNLVALRRLIYLTIQSSLDYEECAHKMMKLNIKPGQEHEFCFMVLECCGQQRSYEKFFGLLGQRFCLLKKEFMEEYTVIFKEQYDNCHQLETNKLRNTAKFFGHLLHSDAIPWTVLESINLNEDDTTSSSRIFIKILFQDLAEYLGLEKLKKRLADPIVAPYIEGVFPRDNPRNTRFSINFFTAVGLGGLTEDLRAHLKTMPKVPVIQQQQAESSGSSSDSSSSSSSDSSSSSSSSEEDEGSSRRRRKKKKLEQERREERDKRSKREGSERNRKERRSLEDERRGKSTGGRARRESPEGRRRRGSADDRRGRESPENRHLRESSNGRRLRESPEYRRRRDASEERRRRESHDERRRRESPEDRRRRESPENRQGRESPEERRRRESPDERRRRESPGERRRRESPDERRRRESPDERRRRESPKDRRRRKSPDERRRSESPKDRRRRKERSPDERSERSYRR